MASQTFNLAGSGNQDSATITIGASERLRVRFTSVAGTPNLFLAVTSNGTTSYVLIDNPTAWTTLAVLTGDVVGVRMRGNSPNDAATGVIESGAGELYAAMVAPTPTGTNSIGGVNVDNVADSLVTTGSATGVATVVFAPTKGFQGGSFQVISAGTGNTVTFEQSNDSTDGANGTWASLYVANSGGAGGTTTSNPVVIAGASYKFESTCAMVRARVSTYGSGTVTITLCQKRLCAPVSLLSLSSGTNTIGNVNVTVGYTDSAVALTSAATYTGTGRAVSGAPFAAYFNATAYADQAGTLSVWQSTDSGATYYQMQTLAITAGTSGTIQAKVTGANSAATLYQVRYTNGATAQGVFRLSSSFTAG
jgi:hypothetical protein